MQSGSSASAPNKARSPCNLHLPLKEVAAALQEGVGHLMRQAGLELMQLIMDEEVRELARRALPTPSNPTTGDMRKASWSPMDRKR